ncbi:putative sigma-54 modulation protein [Alkalispirochaeta americana]|uniref:Putative sigma-54 modulation protein n=1 Tax=Alkalispirochaeta americana TaxID=159291 RepID=A0A1N6U1V0_9SPIO|nr:HPF/RaiA family ribosome-associated protein [Alkalispirochaeta americana]SIQ59602.1 putative sigma-54 modulation protein [Alkalispirochaeta americana]
MNITIKSVHFDASESTREFLEERLQKIDFATDKIVDLDFTLTREKDHQFEIEAKIHFRWGLRAVVKTKTYDLNQGIHELVDKVDMKVRKEVEKVQEHKA